MILSQFPRRSRFFQAAIVLTAIATLLAVNPADAQVRKRRRVVPKRKAKRPTRRPTTRRPSTRRPSTKRPTTKRPTRRPGSVIGKGKPKPPTGPGNVKTNGDTGKSPLASVFAGDDGGAYYVSEYKEKGKPTVVMYGEHPGRGYALIFRGSRSGSIISGNYLCLPRAKSQSYGSLKMKVNGNGSMTRFSATGTIPTKKWSIRSMKSIVHLLPGKKNPKWTQNGVKDLDGAFDDAKGYRYYIRETAAGVYGLAEAPFKKGKQPAAVMAFFLKRQGSKISGRVVGLPKGMKKGTSMMSFNVKSNRSMTMTSGIPFGGGPLVPVLPDIRIPIKDVMDILNSQMNKVEINLDSYHNGPANRSYVKFGNAKPVPFPLPYVTVKATKIGRKRQTFVNDVKSDIINVKSLGGNKGRVSVIFEHGGKELKRRMVGAIGDDDKRLADWDVHDMRVDVEFALVNYGKSISYEVKKVKLHARVDVKALPEKLDEWVSKKLRPKVEGPIKDALNHKDQRSKVSDAIDSKLKKLQDYLKKYSLYGYSPSSLAPKKVFVDGKDVVIRFRD